MVVGDSLTYGAGIEIEDTFVALLNRWLSPDYRVEVLNLGLAGGQSEDILKVIKKFQAPLSPDLIIYAVCLNDFLPLRHQTVQQAEHGTHSRSRSPSKISSSITAVLRRS